MAAKYGDDASELVRLKIISPELKDSEKIYKSHCDKLFSLIAMPEQLLTWGLYVAGWRSAQHHAQINLYTSKMQGGSKFKDISISQEELESAARDILDNFVPKDMDEASSKIFRNLIGEREDWLDRKSVV